MTTKRVIDLIAAFVLTVLTLPVVVVLAVVLAVHLRAWPFFTHERIGHDGRMIRVTKLRTLPPSTRPYALKTEVSLETSRLCLALRRLHLDELPQLWLVVVGAMSLVGPRPKMPDEHEPVDPIYGYERVTVPQGITGLWQVSDATNVLPSDAMQYDLFYVRNQTLLLDLWILWRTIGVVLGLGGEATLGDVPTWALPVTDPARRVVVSTDLTPTTALGRRALDAAREARRDGLGVVLHAPVPRDADGGYRRGYGGFTRRDLVDGMQVRRSRAPVVPGDGPGAQLRRAWFVLVALVALLPQRLRGATEVVLVAPPGVLGGALVRSLAAGCEVATAPAAAPVPASASRARPSSVPQLQSVQQ